jgi:flagella basal body P-ring formation protein FlgA
MNRLRKFAMLAAGMFFGSGSLGADDATAHIVWWDAAVSELRAALSAARPEVTQWTIRSLADARTLQALPAAAPSTVSVSKIGARSALRVVWVSTPTPHVHSFWFDVVGVAPVIVANRDARGGSPLARTDGLLDERDVFDTACAPVLSNEELESMRARRALRRGGVICRDAIESRPPISRGESVAVRFESGRISIMGTGVALADARLGQSVSVMNAESREIFRAVASADREVTVHQ